MTKPVGRPPLRRDAARNRELLVSAAAEAFQRDGLGASVNAIAADAGVNVATLYRHFASKDELLGAVLDSMMDPLRGAVARALAAPAGSVLATFAAESTALQQRNRGFVEVLRAEPIDAPARVRLRELTREIVEPLVVAAHAGGELRADLDAIDLMLALQMLGVAGASAAIAGRDPARYADIILRGLRPT